MIKVELQKNNGFKWFSSKEIYFKGFFWDSSNRLYKNDEALVVFENITDQKSLRQRLKELNGSFCLIIQRPEKTFLVSDIIRTFPLFYRKTNDGFQISDNAYALKIPDDKINFLSFSEYEGTGFVFQNRTLIEKIYQTQAGQIVELTDQKFEVKDYYDYLTLSCISAPYDVVYKQAEEVILDAFHRLVKSLEGRMVVICLSSGYDSRLIACMLKYFDYRKVLCITYGKKNNNPEIITSKKVAGILGFNWEFVEYNDQLINDYFASQQFNEYYKYSGNFSSMFMMHEYFAVQYLKENRLIDDDAIFVAGHSGDFLAGSQISKLPIKKNIKRDAIADLLYEDKMIYQYHRPAFKKEIKKALENEIGGIFDRDRRYLGYSVVENWDMKEKLSKFIANSSTVFDFWGYEFRLPFWDRQLTDFFRIVPYELKLNKILYISLLKQNFFKNYQLNFSKENYASPLEMRLQFFKKRIKKHLPYNIVQLFTKQIDYHNYRLICKPMLAELSMYKKISLKNMQYLNSVLIQWYLHKITKNK